MENQSDDLDMLLWSWEEKIFEVDSNLNSQKQGLKWLKKVTENTILSPFDRDIWHQKVCNYCRIERI